MRYAEENFEKAINEMPNNPDNYFNMGNVHLNRESFDEAHQFFDKAISIDSKNAKFYHAKGLAFQAQAEFIERNHQDTPEVERETNELTALAIDQFETALKYSKTFISSMFHLGLMFKKTHRFKEALIQFSNVQNYL